MTLEEQATLLNTEAIVSLLQTRETNLQKIKSLEEEVAKLTSELSWFKKQIFGQRSEKRKVLDDPRQLYLGEQFAPPTKAAEAPKTPVEGYQRGKAKKKELEGSPDDTGLRFGPEVPVEVIQVPNPELKDLTADDYEVIDTKSTYRLAQKPASYVVLKYERQVVKLKEKGEISCAPAPRGVFERSLADVTFLAGLLIDKFLYHMGLYRQHQRLKDGGIVLSRGTLTNFAHNTCSLLEPIYEANYASVVSSF